MAVNEYVGELLRTPGVNLTTVIKLGVIGSRRYLLHARVLPGGPGSISIYQGARVTAAPAESNTLEITLGGKHRFRQTIYERRANNTDPIRRHGERSPVEFVTVGEFELQQADVIPLDAASPTGPRLLTFYEAERPSPSFYVDRHVPDPNLLGVRSIVDVWRALHEHETRPAVVAVGRGMGMTGDQAMMLADVSLRTMR